MKKKRLLHRRDKSASIFRSIFAPLFIIMILQALIFYFAAVYGGIEESLSRNAADILAERLEGRKAELEAEFVNHWTNLDDCANALGLLYEKYEAENGGQPFADSQKRQIAFLKDGAKTLIGTLRHNEVNGIFLILNDQRAKAAFPLDGAESKYGLCIRDMDPDSNYQDTEDLQLERAPSSIVDSLGCILDSWWEAKYTFRSRADGDYFYAPLDAAWDNPGADGDDLAYCSQVHQISASDPDVVSYSMPLLAKDGYPYGVLGIEMTARRLASLLPSRELNDAENSCYVLAMRIGDSADCLPIVATGAMYSRCFQAGEPVATDDRAETGGFWVSGGGVKMYGAASRLDIYNNNSPFENRQLVLLALVESDTLFGYIGRVKATLMVVALISLLIGVLGIGWVSRRFARPITALAGRVRGMDAHKDVQLGHVGVTEIDQLVDSIEELNRNVNKNSARTEFFSRMSHDMRTPMNAIISFSSPEMLSGETEAVKDDYLKKIHASGELLLALINEVLDMTKIESNKTVLREEPLRADALCGPVVPIIAALAANKDVAFTTENSFEPGTYVLADKQHLNQIVMNLLSNAVKFTKAGGAVGLSVRDLGGDEKETRCQIVVADTGVGMSEAFQKKLYTPFEQDSNAQGGTGLGLSIAQKLVGLMGGVIECQSRLNAGTTFTVTLPLRRCEAPAAEPVDSPTRARDMDALRGKKILVCEDNALNTLIMVRLLASKGILTQSAPDGQQGAQAFAASGPGEFDAILMDIRMPVLDGLETTRQIRAMDRPDAKTVPIIAMTANAFEEDERASAEAGMNAHLSKPIEPDRLFDTLLKYFS